MFLSEVIRCAASTDREIFIATWKWIDLRKAPKCLSKIACLCTDLSSKILMGCFFTFHHDDLCYFTLVSDKAISCDRDALVADLQRTIGTKVGLHTVLKLFIFLSRLVEIYIQTFSVMAKLYCLHATILFSHTTHALVYASRPRSTHLLRDRVLGLHTWAL